jgi:hypothetical protein
MTRKGLGREEVERSCGGKSISKDESSNLVKEKKL